MSGPGHVATTMPVQARKTEEKKQWAPISIYLNLSNPPSNPESWRQLYFHGIVPISRGFLNNLLNIPFSIDLIRSIENLLWNFSNKISSRISFLLLSLGRPAFRKGVTKRRNRERNLGSRRVAREKMGRRGVGAINGGMYRL